MADPIAAAVAAAAVDAPTINFKAREVVPGRIVLIDGDYLVYVAAGGAETPLGDARLRLMQKIDDLKTLSGAERVVLHLTATGGHKGWRYVIATQQPYQGQRDGSKRPKNWEALRDFVETYKGAAFQQKLWATREADDGICLHKNLLPYGKAVVAMKDKDSQMFDGCIHIDWDTFEMTEVPKGAYEIENSVGRMFGSKWFWLQLLMGDSADHIPGLPQILSHTGKMVQCGEARARNALVMTTCDLEAFLVVCKNYAHHYRDGWADRLVEQMALLWMRGDKDGTVLSFTDMIPRGTDYTNAVDAAAIRLDKRVKEAIDATPDI
jgi:hypothetical protein